MAFNYNKNKNGDDHGNFWTSYSDLFLGMSVVFLLLYVTASLRTGANSFQTGALAKEVQDLKNQLKAYDSVKQQYLKQEATEDESRQYNELMDKLSLLQEEAKDERNKMAQQATELDKKEKALNQYQQMVRNIINANALAKTKIARRENVIEKQDVTIEDQDQEITQLETDVRNKQNQIAENERKIADANDQLDKRLQQLKNAYKQNKMTQKAYQAQMAKIKADAENKLGELREANEEYQEQLTAAQGQLGQIKGQLNQTQGQLAQTSEQLAATKGQLGQTAEQLAATRAKAGKLAGELGATKGKLGQLEGELGATKGKLGQLEGELGQAKGQVGQLAGELGKAQGELGQVKGKVGQLAGELGQAKGQIGQLKGDLAKAQAEADARREISRRIREGFAKAGVKADIDDRTGEVVINFGDVYFDNDSSKLKPQMKQVLEKAMPEYSKALFADNKLRDKITSVEVIGFASPTYQGKIVDPKSLDSNARQAVDYNMNLSYNRARAIFQYIFDSDKLSFQHQKDLLPLIKVTGRSFLAEKMQNARNPSSKNYCDTHDCKKAQRVIIKFSFDDKK